MSRSVIISGPPAVGKTTLAIALAKRFELRHISGGDILKELAKSEGAASGGDDWWDRPEGMKFLERRMGDDTFDHRVDERLKDFFDAGSVVITSYTLPWLVSGGTKIWLAGSHESSTHRMHTRDSIKPDEARKVTQQRYDANVKLYKRLYGIDFGDDLTVFDCVIETDDLAAEQVIEIAARAIEGRI